MVHPCWFAHAKISHHPRLQRFLACRNHYQSFTWLAEFGAETAKPIRLFSSSNFVCFLYRKLNRKLLKKSGATRRYRDRNGVLRYNGTKKLKSTQQYPPRFGRQAFSVLYTINARHERMIVYYEQLYMLRPAQVRNKFMLHGCIHPNFPHNIDFTNDDWEDAKSLRFVCLATHHALMVMYTSEAQPGAPAGDQNPQGRPAGRTWWLLGSSG